LEVKEDGERKKKEKKGRKMGEKREEERREGCYEDVR
jgi:hypothetical protein